MRKNYSVALEEQILQEAEYFIKHKSTVRKTAAKFNLTKSTIHIHLTKRLPDISPKLAKKVSKILKKNFEERHLRGGYATQQKYQKLKN